MKLVPGYFVKGLPSIPNPPSPTTAFPPVSPKLETTTVVSATFGGHQGLRGLKGDPNPMAMTVTLTSNILVAFAWLSLGPCVFIVYLQ